MKRKLNVNITGSMTAFVLLFGTVPIAKASSLHYALINAQQTSQNQKVKGKVTDESGKPLVGVTIKVKGTSIGTKTDSEGNFNLNATTDQTLVITYVGYISKEVPIGKNPANLTITLDTEVNMLEETVVVGFGRQKKVNLTGAVATVDAKAFENRAVSNVGQALQGVMPGLNITQSKGYLNSSPSINIRGVGTIGEGSSSSPLILVDGIESDINRVNPQDIESVSVLKDAASSSIYGSRAPFGVILITTKKGKQGKISTSFNSSLRWQKLTIVPKIADSYTFATYMNETATNGGTAGHFSAERLQKIKDFQEGKLTGGIDPDKNNPSMWADLYDQGYANTNWFDVMFKDMSFANEHNVSLNGGSEKIQMYASANYLSQDGFVALNTENNQRIGTNLKVSAQPSKYIDLTYNIRYNNIRYRQPTNFGDGTFWQLTRQGWPTLPAYDPNGYLYAYATNALALRDGGDATTKSDEAIHALNIKFEPIKDWKIFTNINYSRYNERWHSELLNIYNHDVNGEPVLYTLAGNNTSVNESYKGRRYFNPNVYTEFQKQLKDHYFKVMTGFQTEIFTEDVFGAGRLGIISPGINTINTTSGTDGAGKTTPPSVNGAYDKWSTVGFFGRINYNFAERYLLEANLRYDGTSRFRQDKRWKLFPSVSMGWNIANEAFFEPLKSSINTLKLRGSWGMLGNQNTKLWYPTYLIMPVGTSNGDWLINGARPNSSSAPGLISQSMAWETIRSVNGGLDITMLKNRLDITVDIYKRWTDNMIGPAPEMPIILGTAVPKTNNTDLVTSGWEASVKWNDRFDSGFGYNVGLNIADSRTTITNYPTSTSPFSSYYPNKNMGEIWGFETVGIAKSAEEMNNHLASLPNGGQNAIGNNWDAGDIMYKDLNGDGKVDWGSSSLDNPGDMKVIGNGTPRYAFGIQLGANYKGFDFNMFMQGIMKKDYYTSGSQDFWGAGGGLWDSTVLLDHLDYFRADASHHLGANLDSYYPRPLWSGKNKQPQTRYLVDASYIRLKNVSFGYTIPNQITEKIGFKNLRFSFTGENLWTGTKTPSMYDPETIDSYEGRIMYPLTKVYSFGIKADF